MHKKEDIIDRDVESDRLLDDIIQTKEFTINILYAPTAIGKSSVTIKLSHKLAEKDIECIMVRTNPINKTTLQEWTFVNCLFDELSNFHQNSEHSFESFINSNQYFLNLKAKKELEVLKDVSVDNIMFKPFLIHQVNNLHDINDILLENDKYLLYAKQQYIYYLMEIKRLIIIIDNLQIIDSSSFEFFRRCFLFNGISNHYIIFEYTDSDGCSEEIQKIGEFFDSDNIRVKRTHIKNTDSKYIADIIDKKVYDKPKSFEFNHDLVSYYMAKNTGNIRELIDFSLNYEQNETITNNQTIETLLKLDEKELFVLFVLLEFDGHIEMEYLVEIFQYAKVENIGELIEKLKVKHLISCNDKSIGFEHASITDALNTNIEKLTINKTVARNIIKSYVEFILNTGEKSIYPFLKVILKIYKDQSPVEIKKLMNYIEKSIIVNLQPLEAWDYLNSFIEVTINDVDKYISLYLVIFRLCFKFELYSQGFSCLEKAYSYFNLIENPEIIIYRMLYLAALDKHEENISYFSSIKNLLTNDRVYLTAYLAVLSSYRSLGDYKNCLKIHKKLKKRKFKKYIEYGYRNRLVDMYLGRAKSIKYLKKSIKYFENKKQIEQQAKSLITYTHILGGLGRVEEAKKQIAKAELLLEDKVLGRHMIFVNKAVLNLVDNMFDDETYYLLDMAETSANVPFDKLAIIVNKLAWCYENNRYDIVHTLTHKAEQLLPLEPDLHIHSLLYYNLFANYKKEGRNEEADAYLIKAKQTMQYCDPVRTRLLNEPTKETQFILRKPWHICYLTYWTFDVLLDDTDSS